MTRRVLDIILAAAGSVAAVAIWLAADSASARNRHYISCKEVKTTILDSAQRRFVSGKDVEKFLEEYTWMGQRIDEVDLARMENILDSKGAIRKSNVWTGYDGVVHVEISQREPVIRFQSGQYGWYADNTGFLFPLQEKFTVRVPIVDGALPLSLAPGFKGMPENEKEREWLGRMIALSREMGDFWTERISQISVLPDGELLMIPRQGTERFRFGQPTDQKEKLEKMKLYYESIAPAREKPYVSIDLRYRGQIVCR